MLEGIDFLHLLHTFLFATSVILFLLLIYLVVSATPPHMTQYAVVIFNLLSADVMMTATIVLTMCNIIPLDFGFAMNFVGYCTRFGQTFCKYAFLTHFTGYVNLAHLNYLSFYVRYRALISKPFTFRGLVFTSIVVWVSIYAFCFTFMILCSAPDEDTLWKLHETFPNETVKAALGFGRFRGTSDLEWFRAPVLMSNMVFGTLFPIAGILHLRYKINAVFAEQSRHLSKATVSFHRNMMKVFTIQSITPIAKMLYCMTASVHIFWWHTDFVGKYLYAGIACIPIFNSLVSIFCVTPYRRTLFKRLSIETTKTTSFTATGSAGAKATSTADLVNESVFVPATSEVEVKA